MGTVKAICISEKKGTQKNYVDFAECKIDHGIVGDAHAGNWHRQISILSYEKVEAFKQKGADIKDGAFGENLIVSGYDFKELPIGTRFQCNDVLLELTQVGKQCHHRCQIFDKMGDCIMPREGIFCKVIKEGIITPGDDFIIQESVL